MNAQGFNDPVRETASWAAHHLKYRVSYGE